MRLDDVRSIVIPEGEVKRIEAGGMTLWSKRVSLVAFGDSIAGGHAIDENWSNDYGPGSQYGIDGNTETEIVPGCYTDLMRGTLAAEYGSGQVKVTSFARSGDRVDDLIVKLGQAPVISALSDADFVTACIGANDVLEPALSYLEDYIYYGDLTPLAAIVEENLARLADDSDPNSYKALFDKMKAINPNAKYAFMSVYNPYKYLYLDDSEDGFFDPLLDAIPQITILGFEVDEMIRSAILGTSAVQTVFSRVNGLSSWSEKYVTMLNQVLAEKIAEAGPNFVLADAKAAFDVIPDRPVSAPYHYNDLVNVEYTRGYDWNNVMWTPLWYPEYGNDSEQYWIDLATRHVSWNGFDANGLANELVPKVVERVIQPNVDPHPEPYGHQVLAQVFNEAIG